MKYQLLSLALYAHLTCFGAAQSNYDDFVEAKRHRPEIATAITPFIQVVKGNTAMELQSGSVTIGDQVVISCYVAGYDLQKEVSKARFGISNIAQDIAFWIKSIRDLSLCGRDFGDQETISHYPNGKNFRQALFNVGYFALDNVSAFCIISTQFGSKAYFMKQESEKIVWLGKDKAKEMAQQRQLWVLRHPNMFLYSETDKADKFLEEKNFDITFDVQAAGITDYLKEKPISTKRRRRE